MAGRCYTQGPHVQFPGYIVTKLRATLGTRYIGDPSEAAPILWATPTETSVVASTSKSAMESALELVNFYNQTRTPEFILNPDDASEPALVSVSREEG